MNNKAYFVNAMVDGWCQITHSKSIIGEDGSLLIFLSHSVLSIHYVINKIQCLKQEQTGIFQAIEYSILQVGGLSCRSSASADS